MHTTILAYVIASLALAMIGAIISSLPASNRGADMYTTILAYVIASLALAMIGGGVWGLSDLWRQRARVNVPRRYYGMAIGMICGGFGMGGIAQGLRVLVAIAKHLQNMH